jgi:hypothetical protein
VKRISQIVDRAGVPGLYVFVQLPRVTTGGRDQIRFGEVDELAQVPLTPS